MKKAEDVAKRRENGAQEVNVGSARKVLKKDGHAVPVKFVLRAGQGGRDEVGAERRKSGRGERQHRQQK